MDTKQVLKFTVEPFVPSSGIRVFLLKCEKTAELQSEIPIELLKPKTEDSLEHYIVELKLEPT